MDEQKTQSKNKTQKNLPQDIITLLIENKNELGEVFQRFKAKNELLGIAEKNNSLNLKVRECKDFLEKSISQCEGLESEIDSLKHELHLPEVSESPETKKEVTQTINRMGKELEGIVGFVPEKVELLQELSQRLIVLQEEHTGIFKKLDEDLFNDNDGRLIKKSRGVSSQLHATHKTILEAQTMCDSILKNYSKELVDFSELEKSVHDAEASLEKTAQAVNSNRFATESDKEKVHQAEEHVNRLRQTLAERSR